MGTGSVHCMYTLCTVGVHAGCAQDMSSRHHVIVGPLRSRPPSHPVAPRRACPGEARIGMYRSIWGVHAQYMPILGLNTLCTAGVHAGMLRTCHTMHHGIVGARRCITPSHPVAPRRSMSGEACTACMGYTGLIHACIRPKYPYVQWVYTQGCSGLSNP